MLPGTGEVHRGLVPEGGMPTASVHSGLSVTVSLASRECPLGGP